MKKFIAVAVLAVASVAAHAQYSQAELNTGVGLIRECDAQVAFMDGRVQHVADEGTYCLMYISGAKDMYDMLASVPGAQPVFTVPETATLGEIVRVVDKYMHDHPERLHDPKPVIVYNALISAYGDSSQTLRTK